MIVTLKPSADVARIKNQLIGLGLWIQTIGDRDGRAAFVVKANSQPVNAEDVSTLDGVEAVLTSPRPFPKVEAQVTPVKVGRHVIGPGADFQVFAGPCSVDSEDRTHRLAHALAKAGATFLRGGAYKPRTSPYAFQGHGRVALEWMKHAAKAAGLSVVTECMSERAVEEVAEYADMVQVGSRNMQNYALLKSIGETGRPVMLKRGMAATVEEWMGAGEYLLVHGASGVVFCERGVRSFDEATRNLLDLGAVAHVAHAMKAPVIVDPSHATGRVDLIPHLARAARAVGAHGVMYETHDDRGRALSDGPQALALDVAVELTQELTDGR